MLLRVSFKYQGGSTTAITTDRFASADEVKISMQNDLSPIYALPSPGGAVLIRKKDLDGDVLIEEVGSGGITVSEETVTPVTEVVDDKPKDEPFNPPAVSGDIPVDFTSFREKFLNSTSKQRYFMNNIIEKMAEREEKLRVANDILDNQNEGLQKFIDKSLKT